MCFEPVGFENRTTALVLFHICAVVLGVDGDSRGLARSTELTGDTTAYTRAVDEKTEHISQKMAYQRVYVVLLFPSWENSVWRLNIDR